MHHLAAWQRSFQTCCNLLPRFHDSWWQRSDEEPLISPQVSSLSLSIHISTDILYFWICCLLHLEKTSINLPSSIFHLNSRNILIFFSLNTKTILVIFFSHNIMRLVSKSLYKISTVAIILHRHGCEVWRLVTCLDIMTS